MGKCGETLPCTYSSHMYNHYGNPHVSVTESIALPNGVDETAVSQMLRMTYETSHPTLFSEREKD